MLLIAACGAYCNQCAINGPGYCDPGQCQPGYMYDPATLTCQCASELITYAIQ